MKRNTLIYLFLLLSCLLFCCQGNTQKRNTSEIVNPQSLNKGYKFDSTEYLASVAYRDSLAKHSNSIYRCYEQSEFVNVSLGAVRKMLGEPTWFEIKELEYGYEYDESADVYLFGVMMYLSSECVEADDPRFYRCSKILNVPHATIVDGHWRDSTCYVELYFLVNGNDTIAFDGFKASPDFRWLP